MMTEIEHAGNAEMAAADMAMERLAKARRDRLLVRIASLLTEVRAEDELEVAELLVAWIDHVGAGMPDHDPFGEVRADAAFWADVATPAELAAYGAAALRRLRGVGMGGATRKKLFVDLWEAMNEAERRAFIARVDPSGRFRGRAA